jgi:alkylation response protein AidB-like acyl-CoA dehydrogenase
MTSTELPTQSVTGPPAGSRVPAANHSSAEELGDLRAAVRDFLAGHSDESQVRARIEDGHHDPAVWARLTGELGLARLTVPERFQGDGFGFPELRVVLEEQGRALLCSPFLPSAVLAVQALLESADERACLRYLPGIGDGTTIATVAVAEQDGAWDPVLSRTRAAADQDGWLLSGRKSFVLSGDVADLLLVVARTGGGPSLFAVPRGAPGLSVRPVRTLDGTRPMSEVTLDATPAELIGRAGMATPVVHRVLELGSLAVAAEQVGAARALLEMSVDYAVTRQQFGRAIGSFQAIKHKLADMFTRIELSDAFTEGACLVAAEGTPDAAAAAVAAHIHASETFRFVAAEAIQVHGGIGFTWEHPAHLYFRRAKGSENLFGGPAVHHERLLDRLGI